MDGNEKQEPLSRPQSVSIWLDRFEDVFSDFDSRPYAERSLSDDFIAEARKMTKEKPQGNFELKLLLPADKRNVEIEAVVIKNLRSHFRHFSQNIETEKKKLQKRGVLMAASGFLLMVAASYISSISGSNFYFHVLRIILEPSGWFIVWTGLDDILNGARKQKAELDFNLKMTHAKIEFVSY